MNDIQVKPASQRNCSQCSASLSIYNPGTLCSACQQKRRNKVGEENKVYYVVAELKDILGLDSEEQVRRLGREGKIPGRIPIIKAHHYMKSVVDRWLDSGNRVSKVPVSPLQEQAYARCLKGDHMWFGEEELVQAAATVEHDHRLDGHALKVFDRVTCYFCGHQEELPY